MVGSLDVFNHWTVGAQQKYGQDPVAPRAVRRLALATIVDIFFPIRSRKRVIKQKGDSGSAVIIRSSLFLLQAFVLVTCVIYFTDLIPWFCLGGWILVLLCCCCCCCCCWWWWWFFVPSTFRIYLLRVRTYLDRFSDLHAKKHQALFRRFWKKEPRRSKNVSLQKAVHTPLK